jgi:UDP-glucose 4-epimerase
VTKDVRFRPKDAITSASNSETRTVLVTGGCGFIGTNLVKYLSSRGHRIRILDNLSTPCPIWSPDLHSTSHSVLTPATELLVGDVRDRQAAERAIEGVDAVIHLAAHTSVVESLEKPGEAWNINVNGTINLLEACRQRRVRSFVFASSNAVLGGQAPPADESKTCHPLSPYGASKLAGEALCSAYHHSFGLNTISLRFANCYGRCSDHKGDVITNFLKSARQGNSLVIYGDGNQTRDFVHVDDICQAIHLALLVSQLPDLSQGTQPTQQTQQTPRTQQTQGTPSTQETPVWGEVFQIGSGVETSINQLTELMKSMVDCQLSIVHKPKRKGEIERDYSDIAKAKKLLGFEPRIKLQEGLRQLCQVH